MITITASENQKTYSSQRRALNPRNGKVQSRLIRLGVPNAKIRMVIRLYSGNLGASSALLRDREVNIEVGPPKTP